MMTQEHELLWNDEQLKQEVSSHLTYRVMGIGCMSEGSAHVLLRAMRSDYERRIAELEAENMRLALKLGAQAEEIMAQTERARVFGESNSQLRDALAALAAQLAELRTNGCYPLREPQSGVLNTLIETANAPGEDEAWAHLQEDDNGH